MKNALLRLVVQPLEDGGYMAECPDVPGLVARGDDIEQAVANAQGVAAAWIRSCRDHGDPIPEALRSEIVQEKVTIIVPIKIDAPVEVG